MAKYFLTVPDSITLPTDGNKIDLTSACELHRDDSAVPNPLDVDAAGDFYTFVMNDPELGTANPAATAPAQMSAPTVTATGSDSISVDLAAAPADGGSAITSYDLRHSTNESDWIVVTGVTDPQMVSGLTASTLYYVQTRAVNAVDADPSNWSTSGTATTDAVVVTDSFLEDWQGYSANTEVTATSNWANVPDITTGGSAQMVDIGGGDLVLSGISNLTGFAYDGSATIGANRELTVTLQQLSGESTLFWLYIYLHYEDADNYIYLALAPGGFLSYRARSGGASTTDWDRAGEPVTGSSVIRLRHNAGTIQAYLDGVQKGPNRGVTGTPTWSAPVFAIRGHATPPRIASINMETL